MPIKCEVGAAEVRGRAAHALFSVILLFACWARAVPVPLRAVAATAPASAGHPLEAAVDGVLAPENGWSLESGQFQHQFAVFATDKPIAATMYEMRFYFLGPAPAYFLRFGVSVTADETPSLGGHWMPLLPDQATCNFSNGVVASGGAIVRIKSNRGGTVVTLRARAPFTGVTGFRLRMRTAQPDTQEDSVAVLGSAPDGNFLLTEFEVEAEPLHTSNIALGSQVYSSGPVPRELPKQNLTDGLLNTYSRPDAKVLGQDFYFFLDLGRVVDFDHLVIRGRADAAAGECLGDYLVEILEDTEATIRSSQWRALIQHQRLHPAEDGPDVIRATNGSGAFSGSGIRIHNQHGDDLEIAEIEVYPALKPDVGDWIADDARLSGGREVMVPPVRRRLGFTIKSREPGIFPMALTYSWRIPKWSDQWRPTGPEGRVELAPPPPPGNYELQVQAIHSDGVRDQSGRPVTFRVAAPWWRSPRELAMLLGGAGLLGAAAWWRLSVGRVNRRLALAEQHLGLDRERLRIARDMHDEIGARLTYMAFLADRVGQDTHLSAENQRSSLNRLAENARSAISALDNIVWAVNPRHDTVGSLADYLCDYAPTYLEAAGIECRLAMNIHKPQQPLSLTARHGMLMAIKEALQNVVKHAQARNVRLSVRDAEGALEVCILDDGRGMIEKAGPAHRRGLDNMRQRLEEIGGQCEIGSSPDTTGVSVRLVAPLQNLHPPESFTS